MDVEARLLLLQHLNRTALRTIAGNEPRLPAAVKKHIFVGVEELVWSLPPDLFDGIDDVEEEGWETRVAGDARVRDPFDAIVRDARALHEAGERA